MLFPDDIQRLLARRFRNRHRDWFDGGGAWPMFLTLDAPNEHEAGNDPAAARQWVEAWNRVSGLPGEITWESKQWRRLGTQRLPVRLAPFVGSRCRGVGRRNRSLGARMSTTQQTYRTPAGARPTIACSFRAQLRAA